MKVAILGSNGMLGSSMMEKFCETKIQADGFARPYFDAEQPDLSLLSGYDYIINCIGIIKPYIHDDNSQETLHAIKVNAEFPHILAKTNSRIIQIATDCVYDGASGNYVETDLHNATDVYGKTKSLGEVHSDNFLNLRCSIIGREKKNFFSLLEWFLHQDKNAHVKGFSNHWWNGLTTNAFAEICIGIVRNNTWFCGTQHIIPADILSKSEMLRVFAKHFNRQDITITDTQAANTIDRTLSTNNKIKNAELWHYAGYNKIPTIEQMIMKVR